MNDLQSLSLKIAKVKESGCRIIPLALKKQILHAIEASDLPLKEAMDLLRLHPMTFYKWRRRLKKKADTVIKGTLSVKDKKNNKHHKIKQDNFIELLQPLMSPQSMATPSSKTTNQLFLEIDLGHGTLLRIYR